MRFGQKPTLKSEPYELGGGHLRPSTNATLRAALPHITFSRWYRFLSLSHRWGQSPPLRCLSPPRYTRARGRQRRCADLRRVLQETPLTAKVREQQAPTSPSPTPQLQALLRSRTPAPPAPTRPFRSAGPPSPPGSPRQAWRRPARRAARVGIGEGLHAGPLPPPPPAPPP